MHFVGTVWVLRWYVQCARNETQPSRKGGNHPAFLYTSQGSSYPWWLVALAKRNLLLLECVEDGDSLLGR